MTRTLEINGLDEGGDTGKLLAVVESDLVVVTVIMLDNGQRTVASVAFKADKAGQIAAFFEGVQRER